MSKASKFLSRARARVLVACTVLAAAAAPTLAGPPPFALEVPIQPSVIGTAVVALGATALGLLLAIGIGFAIVRKFGNRVQGRV